MTEDHEAHTQADLHPVYGAGPGFSFLLLQEATPTRMGPEDS